MITSNFLVKENYQKIRIDDYLHQARISLKKAITEAQLGMNGYDIKLCESNTQFRGKRLWFECPKCHKRRGVIFHDPLNAGFVCRKCLHVKGI